MDVPYTISLEDQEGHHVTAKLDGNPPTPKEGGGGWEEVQLPKRSSVLVWKGYGLLKLDVPLVFDGVFDDRAVASDYATLRHMYRPIDRETPPPIVQVSVGGGTGIDTVPYLDEIGDWVVSDLQWGEAVGDQAGRRQQQHFVVTLTEYVPDERLKPASKKRKPARTRRYKIQRKDIAGGLGKLAAKWHVKGGWKGLAEWQSPPRKEARLTEKDIGKYLVVPVPGAAPPNVWVSGSRAQPSSGG